MSVWLSELKANWLSWVAVALSMVVAGTSTGLALAITVSDGEAAGPVGGTILGVSVSSIAVVTWQQMRLIIAERQRTYARWKLVGMPSGLVFTFVVIHVTAVSGVFSACGVWFASFTLEPAAEALRSDGIPISSLRITALVWFLSVLTCMGSAVLGAFGPIWRIARRSPIEARFTRRSVVWTWVRFVLAVASIAATYSLGTRIDDPGDAVSWGMGFLILVMVFTPWLLPVLALLVRGIVGANLRFRYEFLAPQVTPWVLCGGMLTGVGSSLRILKSLSGAEMSSASTFLVVLGPSVAPALAASLATSLLLRHRVAADVRALFLAGASRGYRYGMLVWETFWITAFAIALTAVITYCILDVLGFGYDVWWKSVAVVFGAMSSLLLAAKVLVATREERAWQAELLG